MLQGTTSLTHKAQLKAGETAIQTQLGGRLNAVSAFSSRVGVGRFFREVLPREDKLTPQLPPQDLLRIRLLLK